MKNSVWTYCRWAVFIPGAFLAGVVAHVAAMLLYGGFSWLSGSHFDAPINTFLAGGISGYAGVFAGIYIAPTQNKKVPATIIATMSVMMGIVSAGIRIHREEWFMLAEAICVMAGAIVAAMGATDYRATSAG